MGFSYGRFGLCCDFCGHDEPEYNVIKIACPYGYCQSWACCKYCKAEKKHLVCSIGKTGKPHKEICKPLSQKFDQDKELIEAMTNNSPEIRQAVNRLVDNVKDKQAKINYRVIENWKPLLLAIIYSRPKSVFDQ